MEYQTTGWLAPKLKQLEADNARLAAENTAYKLSEKMRLMAEASNARLREELAAAQATIEQMREALTEVVDADECQDADGWLCFELSAEAYHRADAALSIQCNQDALHEALAAAIENVGKIYAQKAQAVADTTLRHAYYAGRDVFEAEAAAHRARKEGK